MGQEAPEHKGLPHPPCAGAVLPTWGTSAKRRCRPHLRLATGAEGPHRATASGTTRHALSAPLRARARRGKRTEPVGRNNVPLRAQPVAAQAGRPRVSSEEDLERGAHRRLDVDGLHVLPLLLEHGHKKVDRGHDVGAHLVHVHGHVGDGGVEAHHLLHLELDGALHLLHHAGHGVGGRDGGGELAGTVEARAKQTGDQLDDGLGGEEGVVLLGHLLHKLLVLVELLELLHGAGLDARVSEAGHVLGVLGGGEDAKLEVADGAVRELHGAGETLVLRRVVVLERDLELDGLLEGALLALHGVLADLDLLALGVGEDLGDGVGHEVGIDLGHGGRVFGWGGP
mmetsp:Transcript_19771/g.75880  ORF Transcript_19771/g.75880 Transcript_19771/m.75880 type:complete len:341 (-) Transcript_19771:13-1035(-)